MAERSSHAATTTVAETPAGGGMTVLLPQAVGLRRAIEMWLTGNYLTAAEALQAGLVNHVVPHEELLPFPRRSADDVVIDGDQVTAVAEPGAAIADGEVDLDGLALAPGSSTATRATARRWDPLDVRDLSRVPGRR